MQSYNTRFHQIFSLQQQKALANRTESLKNRKIRLQKLRRWIKENRTTIQEAIYADFKKPSVEVDATEIFPALDEIKLALDNLDVWARPKKIDAPITLMGTRSQVVVEPKGVCLIIAPWNYPFNLCIGPLASALAAGNTAFIKPSEFTANTAALISKMCNEIFAPEEVFVAEGGPDIVQQLLVLPFDHIFFTGSPAVGKIIMRAAAEHLTSVSLELGGKSPTIVSASAKVKEAARRIAVAKFINNAQTCIAPDYVLVHHTIAKTFIEELKEQINKLFLEEGKSFADSPHYARIVNEKHFNRLESLLQDAVTAGAIGELNGPHHANDRLFHPVLLTNVSLSSRIMEEEIFGPILPILTYTTLQEAVGIIQQRPKPLAIYYFGNSKNEQHTITSAISAGTMCVNDCAVQFLNLNIPFGGVNTSGIGKSHGYYGFLAFSNEKPVMRQRHGITSVSLFYPPYTAAVKKMVNWLLKMV